MTSDVWIIVLTWNGKGDTVELLDGLTGVAAHVLVVDNGSGDGTAEEVRAKHPWVEVLETGANLGFAGGNNRGIEYALAKGARVVCVLNNDTLAEPGFLAPLVAAVSTGQRVAVSPDIRYADDPAVSWFKGGAVDRRGGRPVHADVAPDQTAFLTGCCLVATAQVWRSVGLFDERLFLIFEDDDWSWRARAAGVRLRVVPESVIRHKVSRSFTGASDITGAYYFSRNGLVFAQRHLGVVAVLRFGLRSVLIAAARDVRDRRAARALARLLGLVAAVTGRRGRAGRLVSRVAYRSAGSSSDSSSS